MNKLNSLAGKTITTRVELFSSHTVPQYSLNGLVLWRPPVAIGGGAEGRAQTGGLGRGCREGGMEGGGVRR